MTSTACQRSLAILAVSLTGTSGTAMAAGFYIQEQNAAGVGRAQAGNVAVADDASTIYFNPAGMTELPGIQNAGSIDIIIPTAKLNDTGTFNRSLLSPRSANPSSDGGNPGSATPIPAFYLSAQIPDAPLWVGIGMSAPFGFASKFKSDVFARYDSIDSFVETIDIAPTIAWKVNDWLSIGAGLDEQYAYVKLRNALPYPFAPGGPSFATDGRLTLTGHTWSTGFNAGILLKPMQGTKIGFTYRYGITHEIDHGALTISGLPGALASLNKQYLGSAALDLPDVISFGVSQSITPELTLLAEANYFSWSNFKAIDIKLAAPISGNTSLVTQENYRDTWSFAVGGEYQLTEPLKLRAGFKFDQTPTVDAFRDTRVPDGDRYWLSAGLRYQLTEQIGFDFGYAHIFLEDSQVHIARPFYSTPASPALATSNINAFSEVALDIISLGFTYKF